MGSDPPGVGVPGTIGLPRPESGELVKLPLLPIEPLIDGVREYLGGVLKIALGTSANGVGGSPSS